MERSEVGSHSGFPGREPWLDCSGDGPREDEIGEASERKDGQECATDWIQGFKHKKQSRARA